MIFKRLKNIFGITEFKTSNCFQVNDKAVLQKSESSFIQNSQIVLENDAQLIIGDNVKIDNYHIRIIRGKCKIENDTQLIGVKNTLSNSIYINDGSLLIADHCIIQSEFCIRFGGICSVDSYTGIMYGTEIRCDESLKIGKFNMISYECMIYDTNTHCTYNQDKRRKLTIDNYPYIGLEVEKPETSPIMIGDDCWIGKRAVILKGVNIGKNSTIATCAVVTKSAPPNSLLYGNPSQQKLKS
ncbi:MAG: acyltransferase [Bacteroidia bacterium]|nr:acyltransferase [Bacteroidia bacterium]